MDLNGLELNTPSDDLVKVDEIFTRPQLSPDEKIDLAELFILTRLGGCIQNFDEEVDICPLTHRFTPGMYVREIFMPAGVVWTTKVHKFEHPFVVSQGAVSVYSGNDGPQFIRAPYCGITKAGTRRFLVVHEDTVWTTFHLNPLELRDIPTLCEYLCYHKHNQLLPNHLQHKEYQMRLEAGNTK